jgi:hypothetical protein
MDMRPPSGMPENNVSNLENHLSMMRLRRDELERKGDLSVEEKSELQYLTNDIGHKQVELDNIQRASEILH